VGVREEGNERYTWIYEEESDRGYKELHNEEHNNFCCSRNIIMAIKPRRKAEE
jgi:hypothetical protein